MTDFAQYQGFELTFAKLLADLSKTWTQRDILYIRDIVSHAEYGDALENLIAIGQQNGKAFSADHLRQIGELSRAMGIDTPAPPKRAEGITRRFSTASIARSAPR